MGAPGVTWTLTEGLEDMRIGGRGRGLESPGQQEPQETVTLARDTRHGISDGWLPTLLGWQSDANQMQLCCNSAATLLQGKTGGAAYGRVPCWKTCWTGSTGWRTCMSQCSTPSGSLRSPGVEGATSGHHLAFDATAPGNYSEPPSVTAAVSIKIKDKLMG